MKSNTLIWIIFCGIIYAHKLFPCSTSSTITPDSIANKIDDLSTIHSIASEIDYQSTPLKLDTIRLWMQQLTDESKKEGINPLWKNDLLTHKNYLNSIITNIEKDRTDAGLR